MKALFDSNILIDYLNGLEAAKSELDIYSEKYISVITYIEVLAGARSKREELLAKAFLECFKVIYIDNQIAQETAMLKEAFNLKLGDALILATSKIKELIVVTRGQKDFDKNFNNIRVPYTI